MSACGSFGSANVADCEKGRAQVPCEERTPDEQARIALDKGDLDTAVEILSQLVKDEPDEYERYPLLAAAYAGKSGFSILNIAKAQSGSSTSLLDLMGEFLPNRDELGEEAYAESVDLMGLAVDTLEGIPSALRAGTSAFASSVQLQFSLYQSAYGVRYLNKFVVKTDGAIDISVLETMSNEDAILVIQSLAAAAAAQSGDQGAAVQAATEQAIAQINSQGGENQRENLIAFVQTQH